MNLLKLTKKIIVLIIIVSMLSLFIVPINEIYAATQYTQSLKSGISNFPKEYQDALNKLKDLHPNWTFEAYNTGLSWDNLILNETATHGRNRIIKSADNSWKCSCGNVASGYACASEDIIAYYLDPRNFLNEVNVFQFLEISYNSKIHDISGIKSAVKNTFLDSNVTYKKNGTTYTKSYSEIILQAAKESNMSPYSIVTKIIQEVGSKGSSSVTGTYSGYEGYYNFFNLGAYDSGNAIVNGLRYAKDKGWDNQYDSIIDGAKEVANSYTNAGQNTAYFYKWDVVGTKILQSGSTQTVSSSNMFWHQYMANVQDPTSQSKSLYNTYASNGIIDAELNFIIPVYNNMPSTVDMPSGFASGTENLYSVNCTDGLRVRSKASTSGSILATLYKNTKVQVLEKECATANGIVWDKVKLSNGVTGYVADKYLTACETSTQTNTGDSIGIAETSENLKLRKSPSTSGVLIKTISKGTKVDMLEKDVSNDSGYHWYKIRVGNYTGYVAGEYLKVITYYNTDNSSNDNNNDNNNNDNDNDDNKKSEDTNKNVEVNNSYAKIDGDRLIVIPTASLKDINSSASGDLKTNGTIKIYNNSYTVIMLGDTNEDGEINSADLLKVVKHLNGTSKLGETAVKSADVNQDNTVNSADLLKIVKHLIGSSKINL